MKRSPPQLLLPLLALVLSGLACSKTNLKEPIAQIPVQTEATVTISVVGKVELEKRLVSDPALPSHFQDIRYQHTAYKDMLGLKLGITHFPGIIYQDGRERDERTTYFLRLDLK